MGWINLALFVLRNRRARSVVIGIIAGLVAALGLLIIVLVAMLGALFSMCSDEASTMAQPTSSSSPSYGSSEPSDAAISDIPENFLQEYQQTGEETGIDWAILAAIGKQETDHGRLEGYDDANGCITSVDNAKGPMQFIPSTWASQGVDGNGDGEKDPCVLEDAVPATAGYLQELGAPEDYRGAVCNYYGMCADADADYANSVLAQAEEYRQAAGDEGGGDGSGEGSGDGSDDSSGDGGGSGEQPSGGSNPAFLPPLMDVAYAQDEEGGSGEGDESGAVFPLPEEYTDDYEDSWGAGRSQGSHEGSDIMAPTGTPIKAMVDGTIRSAEGSDDENYSELGGYNIMLEADRTVGPIKEGDRLYYAHMNGPPSVSEGDEVSAGDTIGEVGSTGYGPKVTDDEMPEHLHLGWYDPTGERADSPSGAINPYPMLQWVEQGGGSSEEGYSEGSNSSEGSDTGATPTTAPTETAADQGSLPAYCTPFKAAGLIQDVGRGISNLAGGGGGNNAFASEGGGGGVEGTVKLSDYSPLSDEWQDGVARLAALGQQHYNLAVPPQTYPGHGSNGPPYAIDFVVAPGLQAANDQQQQVGDAIAAFLSDNAEALNIRNVIWDETIYMPGTGSRPYTMEDARAYNAGTPAASQDPDSMLHRDHVHVETETSGPDIEAELQGQGLGSSGGEGNGGGSTTPQSQPRRRQRERERSRRKSRLPVGAKPVGAKKSSTLGRTHLGVTLREEAADDTATVGGALSPLDASIEAVPHHHAHKTKERRRWRQPTQLHTHRSSPVWHAW